jgi:hypothetical protein
VFLVSTTMRGRRKRLRERYSSISVESDSEEDNAAQSSEQLGAEGQRHKGPPVLIVRPRTSRNTPSVGYDSLASVPIAPNSSNSSVIRAAAYSGRSGPPLPRIVVQQQEQQPI